MNDRIADESAQIDSPCIRNCCLDDHDVCLGCGRTLAEILAWSKSDKNQRLIILARCEQRKKSMSPAILTSYRYMTK
ncbi:DUF1289 domain-containing protein [Pseudoalteromonas byunsanensis]|uniref:DUF1289 domain-containing protein n=1 Tax=Pseudoalteromonas byunsanensis TaxID=327939 RepID=A0A1S1NB20_9GAMM|nr:DUF1289 domain-containing protein [Pseudoalteromonas byunsanensis]OHU96730.1 hypothetical protein BIW53_05245 [Pseudoalteromonas byunsanensis]